jgi:hypothetical protein
MSIRKYVEAFVACFKACESLRETKLSIRKNVSLGEIPIRNLQSKEKS